MTRINPTHPLLLTLLLVLSMGLIGWAATTFQSALPGYGYEFPRDHAAHNAFKTEWWYYTGHLESAQGQDFGYELTFFRIGRDPQSGQMAYAAHLALTDVAGQKFHYRQKLNRSGWAVAGSREDWYEVWNELWSARLLGDHQLLDADFSAPNSGMPESAKAEGPTGLHLLLTSQKPPVIHGEQGVSQKAGCRGCASHYYSLTRMRTEGYLVLDGKAMPVTGLSWMDHEFGSNQLAENQTGWDWFSLQLSDGTEVMLYVLRRADGTVEPNSSGSFVAKDGATRHLMLKDFTVTPSGKTWKSPATGGAYPQGWTVRIPSESLELTITPVQPNQELATDQSTGVAYWEGASTVSGIRAGKPLTGQAYVEMTGYAKPFKQKL